MVLSAVEEFQLIAILSIAAVGALGAVAPWLITSASGKHQTSTGATFSYANMGSSGVFLAAGLVHMLPDASEDLAGVNTALPLASTLCGLGFCMLLLIERTTGHREGGSDKVRKLLLVADRQKDLSPVSSEPHRLTDTVVTDTNGLDEGQPYALYDRGDCRRCEEGGEGNWVTALVLWGALSAHSLLAGAQC